MMRTLGEILDVLKGGENPTYEELYWSLLAVDTLRLFDKLTLLDIFSKKKLTPLFIELNRDQSFNREKRAYARNPKDWVGKNNDPKNPERQKERKTHLKFAEKFLNKEDNR